MGSIQDAINTFRNAVYGKDVRAALVDVAEAVAGQVINLDTGLTQSGYAADAKAVGDRLATVNSSIATNRDNIQANSGQIGTINQTLAQYNSAIATNRDNIQANSGQISTINQTIASMDTSFSGEIDEVLDLIVPEYSSDETYEIGEFCRKDNVLYQCTTRAVSEAWNALHWNATTVGEALNISGLVTAYYDRQGTYQVGDYVIYDGGMYRCKKAHSASGSWVAANWDPVTVTEEIGNMFGTLADDYSVTNTYEIGDYVVYGGKLYRCKVRAVAENWTAAHWDEVQIQSMLRALRDEIDARLSADEATITSLMENTVASVFSATKAYSAGEYVIYEGKLYRFTADHAAGAWVGTDATAIVLGDDVSDLKSALSFDESIIKGNLTQIYGKNLFNPLWLVKDGLTNTADETYGETKKYYSTNPTMPLYFPAGSPQICISFEAYVEPKAGTSGVGLVLKTYRLDGTTTNTQITVPNNTSEWTSFSMTPNMSSGINGLAFAGSSNTLNITHIRNVQIELGNSATTYENPLTAFDNKSSARLDTLDSYGINTYPEIKPMAYKAYVNFASIPFTTGKRLRTNGVIEDNDDYAVSDYVFLLAGESVDYNLYSSNTGICNVGKFNLEKTEFTNLVSKVSGGSSTHQGTYTATEDCYIVFCGDVDYPRSANYSGVKETVTQRIDAIQNVLPSYWETYLNGKKSDINSFISAVGRNGTYFALFTDYHQTQNIGWTPRIVKNIVAEYPVNDVFNLGDDYGSESTAELAVERLNTVAERFKPIVLYNCAGNHDSNPYGAELTEAQWYNPLFRTIEIKPHVVTTGHGYYYIDNPVQKIRYIVLNTRKNGFTVTDNDDTIQIPWFINVLNSVEDGWHVCVMMHMAFEWYKDENNQWYMTLFAAGNLVKAICDGYQNRATGTTPTAIQVPYDFTNAHGKMACVLSGHTHAETSVTSNAGYSIIAFDRDAMYYPPEGAGSSRTEGTVTEQALYLVSINTSTKKVNVLGLGAGTDREFSFT